MRALKGVYGHPACQREPIVGREAQMVENAAGGYVFPVDDWKQLERFLLLGIEGGTYYTEERPLALENAAAVRRCIDEDGCRTVRIIEEISHAGRAAKNDPALFALAMCLTFGDVDTKHEVRDVFPRVARTGTHLLHFVSFVNDMRGWGRGLRNTLTDWYVKRPVESLAYQVAKYRQRDGWSHRDVLRKIRPKLPAQQADRKAVFKWVTSGFPEVEDGHDPAGGYELLAPALLSHFNTLQKCETEEQVLGMLETEPMISWEMVPSHLRKPNVWKALHVRLPMGALVRQLPTLTRLEVLKPLGHATEGVCQRLTDTATLRKARIHPLQILTAMRTYESGRSIRGSHTWQPIPAITEALDTAFHRAFEACEPMDARLYIGVDISGSMDGGLIQGMPGCVPRDVAVAYAMVLQRQARRSHVVAFSDGNTDVPWYQRYQREGRVTPLTLGSTLRESLRSTAGLPFAGTDCALPMRDALQQKIEADAFIVLTDNETWFGDMHPSEALRQYRQKMGIDARLVVIGLTATSYSIADPQDAGMLDIVGCDTATPRLGAGLRRMTAADGQQEGITRLARAFEECWITSGQAAGHRGRPCACSTRLWPPIP